MKRRTHIKWEGFLNCKDLMKLPFVMSITHGKFISSREKLLWQPFLNWCRLIKSFSLSLSLSLIVKYLILPFCQSILDAWHFQKWVRIYIIYLVPVHLFFSCKSFPLSIFWGLLSSHEYKINNQTGEAIFLRIVFLGVFLSIKKKIWKKVKSVSIPFKKIFNEVMPFRCMWKYY